MPPSRQCSTNPHPRCPKTPEQVSGFDRNRCPKTSGAITQAGRGAGARQPVAAYSATDRRHAHEIAPATCYQQPSVLRISLGVANTRPYSLISADQAPTITMESGREQTLQSRAVDLACSGADRNLRPDLSDGAI